MTIPRALVGAVRCMARPARPALEIHTVREAARKVRQETGRSAAQPVALEIAKRVVSELLLEIECLGADPFLEALRKAQQSPFTLLATCGDIDTMNEFVERRVARVRARSGAYLTPDAQRAERSQLAEEITDKLARRYARHLRLGDGF